ncbi:MAG: hypothetical protein KC502_23665 [Myxococcales bacterium]|nr:hypothetical protein [Myxococcales bacterium]
MRLRPMIAALTCIFLFACGGAHLAKRGDQHLAQGKYDQAIADYDAAARASEGDPMEVRRYRANATDARQKAARMHIERGDQAYRNKNLKLAGSAYKKARSYAPTEPLVVERLSTLLKTRVRIESQLSDASRELNALQNEPDSATLTRWEGLVATAEGLLAWRRDYPRAEQLWNGVTGPASAAMLTEARKLLAAKQPSDARTQAERALRLVPSSESAKKLLEEIDQRGRAKSYAADAKAAFDQGRLEDALEAYHLALKHNPTSQSAKDGQALARSAYVKMRIAEARKLRKKRDRRGELMALRAAWSVNTTDAKLAKKLRKAYDRAHKKAISAFYRQGRWFEKRKRPGAALIAYRTATALGGGPKDLPKRLARMEERIAAGAEYKVALRLARPGRGVMKGAANLSLTALRQSIAGAKLGLAGITFVTGKRAMRKAEGQLVLDVSRFELPRTDRPEPRKKKFLDRIEFPPNPAWAEAQARQAAALANLNNVTERLRPLQEKVNALEARLAKHQDELGKLKLRILAEDATYYAHKPKPCHDGTTNCKHSYANQRWAKHLAYHRVHMTKTEAGIRKISPEFSAARDEATKSQEAFDKSEREARETPQKLRKEIWQDHSYSVQLHIVDLKATARLSWMDRPSRSELGAGETTMDKQRVDFSTPGIVIKKQTLEPPRRNSLPDEGQLKLEVAKALATAVGAAVWPKLRLHGERFALRASKERMTPGRIDFEVRALATGKALSDKTRQAFVADVLKATGYDWAKKTVDVSLVPYK